MEILNRIVYFSGSLPQQVPNEIALAAHRAMRAIAEKIINGGGAIAIQAAGDPLADCGEPLLFDWTILKEVARLTAASPANRRLLFALTAPKHVKRFSATQKALFDRLISDGTLDVQYISDHNYTGQSTRDLFARHADACVAIGGGKGVHATFEAMHAFGRIFIPILGVNGSSLNDGIGASGLHDLATVDPARFSPSDPEVLRRELPRLTLSTAADTLSEIVGSLLEQALSVGIPAATLTVQPDVLVLTALDVELRAVLEAFTIPLNQFTRIANLNVWSSTISSTLKGTRSVRVACLHQAGISHAAAVSAILMNSLRPGLTIMCGIAGGVRGKLKIGQPVVAQSILHYEHAAVHDIFYGFFSRNENRPRTSEPDTATTQMIGRYLVDGISSRLETAYRRTWGEHPLGPDILSPRICVVASGDKLIRSKHQVRRLLKIHGKTEAFDMEGGGIADAARLSGCPFTMIRGISDFGDRHKTDGSHTLAARAAAVVAADLVSNALLQRH